MNIYQISFKENNKLYNKKFTATSIADCKERIIRWAFDKWDFVESEEYSNLIKELEENNIYINNIEELDD